MTNHHLQVALNAAAQGFRVLPVNPKNKVPYLSKWPQKATNAQADIEQIWLNKPHAMVGILTGQPNSYWVLDIDPPLDGTVADVLKQLENLYGNFDPWMTVATPRGGLHLYFNTPLTHTIGISSSQVAPNVDVRGVGGYVIFPGSIRHDGTQYKIVQGGQS